METGRTGRRVEVSKPNPSAEAQANPANNDWRWQCCDKEHEEAEIQYCMNTIFLNKRPGTVPASEPSASEPSRKMVPLAKPTQSNDNAVLPPATAVVPVLALTTAEKIEKFPTTRRIIATTSSPDGPWPTDEMAPVTPGRSRNEIRSDMLFNPPRRSRSEDVAQLSDELDYSELEALMVIQPMTVKHRTHGDIAEDLALEVNPRKPTMRRPLSAPMRRPKNLVNSPRNGNSPRSGNKTGEDALQMSPIQISTYQIYEDEAGPAENS